MTAFRGLAWSSVLVLGACGSDPSGGVGPPAPPPPDAGVDTSVDAGTDGGGPAPILETVSHRRELRALWVSTVFGLDFPSSTTLTPAEAASELEAIVDVAAAAGMNALFFQVRTESDALYASAIEPWSRFLSGTQGVSPGYDPLALLIASAHAKGIEVHAWMNPYRALVTAGTGTAPNHVSNAFPDAAILYNNAVTMNPADSRVRERIVSAVRELVKSYDVDGVVFDDYFYPYPAGTPFPDDASYDAYVTGGGTLAKSDWRRANVDGLVSAVSAGIRAEKAWVRWGVAPFGIYRPGMPPGVVGLDAYEELACDSIHWIDQQWVDYLAPQIYWTTTSAGQPFESLVDWWASKAKPERPIVPSLALHKLGTTPEWTTSEYATQIALVRAQPAGAAGQTHFRFAFLRDDIGNVKTEIAKLYAAPARPPPLPGATATSVEPPSVTATTGGVTIEHPSLSTIRGYGVYRRSEEGSWSFERFVPSAATTITLASGRFAISAFHRAGVESPGVVVEVP